MATSTTNLGLTKPAVTDAADIGVLNFNFDKIDKKCNPALFAPSGYGYGDAVKTTIINTQTGTEADFNTALDSVFSKMGNETAQQVHFTDYSTGIGDTFLGTLYKNWSSYGWLKGVSYSGHMMQKVKKGGAWQPWEWVNPPMVLNVEYRTTERYNGAAVYAKLVYVANLPNNATKTIDGVIDNGITRLVDLQYTVNTSLTKKSHDSRVDMALGVESPYAWLTITTTADMSTYSGYVLIKWTKD